MTQDKATSRRDFLKSSALAGGVFAANMSMLSNVHAQDTEYQTALTRAQKNGNAAIIEMLQAHGAESLGTGKRSWP